MTKCRTLLKGRKIIWLYGGYLATTLANISECLKLAWRYLRWSSNTLFHAVADKVSQAYGNLSAFVYVVWWGVSQMDAQLLRQQIPTMAPTQCSYLTAWLCVGGIGRDLRPRNEVPTSSYSSYAFYRGSVTCHGHTRMVIHVQAHTHVRAQTHTFSQEQRGAAFLKRMGLFNGGLRKGGVCADCKVMWKQKCLSLHYTVQASLFFAHTRHNRWYWNTIIESAAVLH